MTEESYDKRISDAYVALDSALLRRDATYPGSKEWENENGKVQEWERTIADLRRAQAS